MSELNTRENILGAYHATGVGAKSGKAYDMCKMLLVRPIREMESQSRTVVAVGYEIVEVDAMTDVIGQLSGQKMPVTAELEYRTVANAWGKPVSVVAAVTA